MRRPSLESVLVLATSPDSDAPDAESDPESDTDESLAIRAGRSVWVERVHNLYDPDSLPEGVAASRRAADAAAPRGRRARRVRRRRRDPRRPRPSRSTPSPRRSPTTTGPPQPLPRDRRAPRRRRRRLAGLGEPPVPRPVAPVRPAAEGRPRGRPFRRDRHLHPRLRGPTGRRARRDRRRRLRHGARRGRVDGEASRTHRHAQRPLPQGDAAAPRDPLRGLDRRRRKRARRLVAGHATADGELVAEGHGIFVAIPERRLDPPAFDA